MNSIPNRPAISDVLIRASANVAFCSKLLSSPQDALAEMDLPAEDAALLAAVRAPNLKEYARQVKMSLMRRRY